ncbi:MAG TPA: sulfatase [Verrucomicrobiales bacterium]|nr:sulfatase [Verrucomicrobiales bacterium]
MIEPHQDPLTRRRFLTRGSAGIGAAALASLLRDGSADELLPHFAPKAKRVIYLHMSGGPSQIETFDPKPQLEKWHGKEIPPTVRGKQRLTTMTRTQAKILVAKSEHKFMQVGDAGLEMNVLFKETAKVVDELCFIRSLSTEPINHDPAVTFLQTGSLLSGRPSMGSWLSYGLGSENANLPTFLVLLSGGGQPVPSRYWHNGFLPSKHQGVQFQSKGDPVLYLSNPQGISHENRGKMIERISELNRLRHLQVGDPEIEARIDAFQLAYRMQTSVPDLMDISRESPATLEAYGAKPGGGSFANNCLLARRLAEAGVRFIQLYDRGWDHHDNITKNIPGKINTVDRASAALIRDLKQRGMLEETLVIWGGEFGRTAYAQTRSKAFGRDHHPRCFSIWMAGGGIKGGIVHGETDDFSYNVARDKVHVHDLQATILHLLGIDHEHLTFRFKGRDFRLTDVHGHVVHQLLA